MTSIQIILIAAAVLATVLSVIAFRSRLPHRLVALALLATGVFFVIFPDSTTQIAQKLGVGRGTDLLLYTGLLAGVHAFLLLYIRTRTLEQQLIDVVRGIAIGGGHPVDSVSRRDPG
jgi:hypothetical protein